MKTPITPTSHSLRSFTLWLFAMLLLVAPAWSQTTPVGGTARQFTVTDFETRQPIQMTDFAGKVLVLDFFAYWCGPCQSSSPDLEINVQRYYAARGGNANGVPVQCLAVSIDDSNPAATRAFIENAGLELAAEDPMSASGAWRQFSESGSIPLFAIINCVEGSPSHGQWELIYKRAGYAGAPALRAVIDRVMPAPAPVEAKIAVESPGGDSLTNNGPPVELGSVMVGQPGTEKTFTIRNTGGANLTDIAVTMNGANAGDFTLNTSRTAATLASGSSTTFKVTFAPTAAGTRSAAIHIASNDATANPFNIRIEGTGTTAPELGVRYSEKDLFLGSAELTFGFNIVGQEGTQRTVMISNTGNAPLTGVSVTIRGTNIWDFEVVSYPASSIAPGASSPVILSFAPSTAGPLNAVLRINSNDADENPFDIKLSGTGTGENVPILEVRNSDIPLDHGSAVVSFGSIILGEPLVERTIVISNLGFAPLTRIYASLGGTHASDFKMIGSPLLSLNQGQNTTFSVQFQPTASGIRNATLRIISNDANQNPFDILITGIGAEKEKPPEPKISLTQGTGPSKNLIHGKSTRNLGASDIGKKGKVMTFKVTNRGTSTLNMLNARFQGKDHREFVLVENLTASSLAPGKSATFKIALLPRKSGTRRTTLEVMSNDKDMSPFTVKLTGIGKLR